MLLVSLHKTTQFSCHHSLFLMSTPENQISNSHKRSTTGEIDLNAEFIFSSNLVHLS